MKTMLKKEKKGKKWNMNIHRAMKITDIKPQKNEVV